MAVDPKKRQKQLAKKAAKRKEARTSKKEFQRKSSLGSQAKQLALAAASPIHECLVPEGIFEVGIGNVILSRKLPNEALAVGFFLTDVWCLGVKQAYFQMMPLWEYDTKIRKLCQNESLKPMDPTCARKLVESAVAYAGDLGFSPHADYHLAAQIFGDIDAGSCPTNFTFGKDGKPLFVSGPLDTPTKCRRILNTLAERSGSAKFDYLIELRDEQATGSVPPTLAHMDREKE